MKQKIAENKKEKILSIMNDMMDISKLESYRIFDYENYYFVNISYGNFYPDILYIFDKDIEFYYSFRKSVETAISLDNNNFMILRFNKEKLNTSNERYYYDYAIHYQIKAGKFEIAHIFPNLNADIISPFYLNKKFKETALVYFHNYENKSSMIYNYINKEVMLDGSFRISEDYGHFKDIDIPNLMRVEKNVGGETTIEFMINQEGKVITDVCDFYKDKIFSVPRNELGMSQAEKIDFIYQEYYDQLYLTKCKKYTIKK